MDRNQNCHLDSHLRPEIVYQKKKREKKGKIALIGKHMLFLVPLKKYHNDISLILSRNFLFSGIYELRTERWQF